MILDEDFDKSSSLHLWFAFSNLQIMELEESLLKMEHPQQVFTYLHINWQLNITKGQF